MKIEIQGEAYNVWNGCRRWNPTEGLKQMIKNEKIAGFLITHFEISIGDRWEIISWKWLRAYYLWKSSKRTSRKIHWDNRYIYIFRRTTRHFLKPCCDFLTWLLTVKEPWAWTRVNLCISRRINTLRMARVRNKDAKNGDENIFWEGGSKGDKLLHRIK